MSDTPVVLIVFNRPETTRRVFEAVRAAKPRTLFIVADGPRPSRAGEAERCAATRAIANEVDWDCDLHRNFSDTNLGCRLRVSSGISWAFESVDRAIVLEDDCVPSAAFFPYCAELLDLYRDDERVMMISGANHLLGRADPGDSFYFTRYAHIWGWATWRRAWARYDIGMKGWPNLRRLGLFHQYFSRRSERYHWDSLFQYVYDGNIDTWDYQWVYSIWANSGLCVAPAKNLVKNVGFDENATHTKAESVYGSLAAEEIGFPLSRPECVVARADLDELEARLRDAHSGSLRYPFNMIASAAKRIAKKATKHG